MKSIVTRWIALILALVMCVGVLPIGALAEGEEEPKVTEPADPANEGGEGENTSEPADNEENDPAAPAEEDGEGERQYAAAPADGEEEPVSDETEPRRNVPAAGEGEADGEGESDSEEPTRGTTDGFDDDRVVTEEGLRIERLSASFHRGADWNGKHWVWTPLNSSEGHDFTYKVTYSFGSTEPFYPGEIEIIIPKYLIKNIDGEYSNHYQMSIPHKDAYGLTKANIYVYEDLGDSIRIFNRIEAIPTQKGFFEVSYVTAESTFEYWDYSSENPMGSDPFTVTINLNQVGIHKEAYTEADPVYIDTTAYIKSAYKYYPDFYDSWQEKWGPEPENANDYYYLVWGVTAYVFATQAYDFDMVDIFDVEDGEVVGYKMSGETEFSDNHTIYKLKEDTSDYGSRGTVLTRHSKATYEKYLTSEVSGSYTTGGYTLLNKVHCTVHPFCGIDQDTSADATQEWSHRIHRYTPPPGHFYSEKRGLDLQGREVRSSNQISSYKLTEFIDGVDEDGNPVTEIDYLVYKTYIDGYASPWTWYYDGEGIPPSMNSVEGIPYYWKKPVHYTKTDNKVTLHSIDGSASAELEAGDYRIDELSLDYTMKQGKYDETIKAIVEGEDAFSDIFVYVQLNGEEPWVLAGILTQQGWTNKNTDIVEDSYYRSRLNLGLRFKHESDEVTGFRVDTENAFFFTIIYMRPYYTLKNSERVMAVARAARESGQEKMYLVNYADSVITDWTGETVYEMKDDRGADYIAGVLRESHISKSIVAPYNDVVNRRYLVTWQCSMSENYTDSSGTNYVEQKSGKFFDLIPAGGEFVYDSVKAYADGEFLSKGEYSIRLTSDYRGTGQTLLEVDFNVPGDRYYFNYQTSHSWETIHAFGTKTHNVLAYESGNESIGKGYYNDGGPLSGRDRELMSGLDDTSAKRFLYTTANHEISILTYGSLGLYKRVKNEHESEYSDETAVIHDMNYSYRLCFATDEDTVARHLIIYDSLENFVGEGHYSIWRGYYTGIDLTVPKSLGIDPVLYYSTVPELDIEANESLDSGAWIKASEYEGDLKDVKAIAVDMWRDIDGEEFVLDKDTQISITIFMRAPALLDLESKDDAAYNNVYLHSQVKELIYDNWDEDKESLEHQDYVRVLYRSVGGFTLHKVDATDETKAISGIYFRLKGTSFYGNEVNIATPTNKLGDIVFENIERGTYTLQEIGGSIDYLIDDTVHTVTIEYDGSVTIDGEPLEEGQPFTVKNSPRVHGDLEFYKRGKIDGSSDTVPLDGVTFNLKGTSEYGNPVNMFRTSIDGGKVVFDNIEWGEYTLTETATVDDYVLLQDTYKVVCDANGLVSIVDLEQENNSNYVIYNEPLHVIKLWKYDDVTGEGLAGAEFTLTGVSDYKTEYNMTCSSDESGYVEFTGLEPGDYIIKETKAPEKHVQDETEHLINVASDGTLACADLEFNGFVIKFPNPREYKGVLTIVKRWRTSSGDVYSPAEGETLPIPAVHAVTSTATIDREKMLEASWWGTYFKQYKLQTRPPASTLESAYRIEDDDSDYPVYLWQDDNTCYWWSEAAITFLPKSCNELFLLKSFMYIDMRGLDSSKVEDMSSMFAYCRYLVTLDLSGFNTKNVTNMSKMFYECFKCSYPGITTETIIFSKNFCTDNVTDMSYMFASCSHMTNIDISKFDTKNVTNMSNMFRSCENLMSLDVSGFDTSSVTNMSYMFYYCSSLTSLDLSGWDTSSVTDMSGMFCHCSSQTLNISSFDTSSVTNMSLMFAYCGSPSLDLSGFDTSNVTNMRSMFEQCYNVTSLDLSSFDTSSVTDMSDMFFGCRSLTSLDLSGWDTSSVTDMSGMFGRCNMTSLDLSSFDTSSVTDMSGMFAGGYFYNSLLTSLDLSGFDTSNVTNMSDMFSYCTCLTELDLSNFDTSSVTDMSSMFCGCTGLTSLDLSGWDTHNVEAFGNRWANSGMFQNCSSLTSLDLSSFNTSSATSMSDMFEYCSSLTSLDLSSFNTSSATSMSSMFSGCSSLTSLDLSSFDTSSVTDMSLMFRDCTNLTAICVGELWSTESVTDSNNMFKYCTNLKGGRGTVYNSSHTDATYAHIDGGTSDPGYFTEGPAPASGGGGSRPTMMLAAPARGLILEAARIDLVTNSELYEGEGDTSEVFDQWIDNGDGTWTYRFHVYDEEATYYIYEGALAGFESDHGVDNYIVLNYVPGEENTAVITNTKTEEEKGSLTIRKRVNGPATTESFSYTIVFCDPLSRVLMSSINLNGDESDVTIVSGAGSFTLKSGESVTISGLPLGVGYIVTETDTKGYTASVNGTVGTKLSSNITDTPVVTFVNSKETPPPGETPKYGSLKVTKTVELAEGVELGKDDGRRYEFTVTLTGEKIPAEAVNIGGKVFKNGKTTFYLSDGESVTIGNIPVGTHYEVTEVTPEGFEVTKTGDTGEIEEDVTANVSFVNKKTVNDKSGGFTLVKELGKGSVGAEKFTFYIELGGLVPNVTYTYGDGNTFVSTTGTVLLTVELSGGESVTFDKLPIGSTYRITEAGSIYKASFKIVNGSAEGNIVLSSAANASNNTDLATAVEFVEEGEEITVTFTNTGVTYPVSFAKLDETGGFLAGAILRISDALGNKVMDFETDGDLQMIDLPAGTFYLSEIEAPEGYYPAEGRVEFTISTSGRLTSGGDIVYFVSITDKQTVVSIQKVDENGQPLAGASLEVIEVEEEDASGNLKEGAVVHMFTSKTEPEVITGVLVSGMKYILRETAAPATYSLAEDVVFTVGTSGVTQVTMRDPKTVVSILKVKEDGTPLAGASLQVLDGTTVVYEFISGTSAEIVTGKLSLDVTYTLHEVSAPQGYSLAPDQTFMLNEHGTTEITMTDSLTSVSILKVDAEGTALAGATLQILDGTTVIHEFTSATTAEVVTGVLVTGKTYKLHEVSSPAGYRVAADVEFTVSNTGATEVTMTDEKTVVSILKVDAEGTALAGATLQILDGTTVIHEFTSATTAEIVTGVLVTGKTYKLHETAAPNGYRRAADVEFTVSDTGTTEVTMTDEKTVVSILKVDESGSTLSGATLRVINKESGAVEYEFISSGSPDEVTGILSVGKTYILHEVIPPAGYRLAPDVEFTVSNDGVTRVVMTDSKTQVLLIKVDDEGKPVTGAQLQIIDSYGKVVYEFVSSAEPERVSGILILGSSYVLHEVKAPDGYDLADDVAFTLDRNIQIEVTMVDTKKPTPTPSLEIQKVTPEGSALEGATLQIISSDGEIVEEWVSTTEPHKITGMKAGEYTLKETAAPYGYLLANEIRFTVTEDGKVILNGEDVSRIVMEDPKEPDEPTPPDKPEPPVEPEPPVQPEPPVEIEEPEIPLEEMPDTGDNSSTALWLALSLLSLAGIATIIRKKKEN